MTRYKQLTLQELGVTGATPAYGLTESYGHATGGWPDDPIEVKLHTDGEPLRGVELQIVDRDTGHPLPRCQSGRVLLRGRSLLATTPTPKRQPRPSVMT